MPVITYLKISLSENLIISFYFLRIFFVDVILSHISTPNVSINGVKLTLRHSAKRNFCADKGAPHLSLSVRKLSLPLFDRS